MENIPEGIKQHVDKWGLSLDEKKTLLNELNTYFKLRKERIEREKKIEGVVKNDWSTIDC